MAVQRRAVPRRIGLPLLEYILLVIKYVMSHVKHYFRYRLSPLIAEHWPVAAGVLLWNVHF